MFTRSHVSRRSVGTVLLTSVLGIHLTACAPTGSGTVTDLTPTALTLNASVSLVSGSKTVTLTGTISPSAAPGYVTFFDGSTAIGVAALSSGTATFSTATLSSGSHALSVGYGGSSAYYASNSAAITLTVM